MAVPPSFSDLGKSAKDVFSKGYGFGTVKLDLKTKSESGVVSLSHDLLLTQDQLDILSDLHAELVRIQFRDMNENNGGHEKTL